MVIADTSVWVEYFRGGDPPVREVLRSLIRTQQAALVGVVLAELLQGCRKPKEAETIPTWKRTGELSATLRRKGITLPLSDLLIAALALEHGCHVYTLDPHFEQIQGLALHKPRRSSSRRPARKG